MLCFSEGFDLARLAACPPSGCPAPPTAKGVYPKCKCDGLSGGLKIHSSSLICGRKSRLLSHCLLWCGPRWPLQPYFPSLLPVFPNVLQQKQITYSHSPPSWTHSVWPLCLGWCQFCWCCLCLPPLAVGHLQNPILDQSQSRGATSSIRLSSSSSPPTHKQSLKVY